jgi:uncharacterized repeat protein (TIGR03837 family)
MRWDIFCQVIDNHGDAGVCWRLAAELARRGEPVRLWIDDPSMLRWMAPGGEPGVTVVPWTDDAPLLEPGDCVVEAFGCDPPPAFVARMAARKAAGARQPAWLNLEYLSAEPYVERCHGLPSPVNAGPGAGLVKHFIYPGFTAATGGLLRERDWDHRRLMFERDEWLAPLGVDTSRPVVSLFCYEPPALPELLPALAREHPGCTLLVTAGRARAAVVDAVSQIPASALAGLHLQWLPLLSQRDYDHLLWSCDLNFVRGEDSVVRALLSGRPFVWQLYPQDDLAHAAKLQAFLQWLRPPASLAEFHLAWNGLAPPALPAVDLAGWAAGCAAAAARAWALPELAATLQRFAAGQARI